MIDLEAIRRLLKRHGLNDSATDLIVNMADRINTIESAGGTTNLSVDFNDGDLVLQSSSGDDVVLPLAGATTPGLLSAALLAKLQSIDAAHYGAPLQSVTELAALSQASLTDKERRYVEAQLSDYFYDSTATSGDVAPDDQAAATGFWRRVSVGGETATSIKTKYESNADTNVFTDAEQTKLAGIATGAEVNVQSDWNVTDANSDAFILNKPDVPTALDDLTGTLDDIADGTTYVRYTPAEQTKLTGIEAGATADQTAAEIKTAYESLVPAATQSEAQAGTETALRVWSPLRVSQAISSLAGSGSGRELLTATRTYFVNASTGNDNNTGLSSGDAFATIQKAVDSTAELDRGTYEVTISVADGTYAAVVLKQCLGSAPVNIIGNLTNPEDVHITTSTTSPAIHADGTAPTVWNVLGVKVSNTSGGTGFSAVGISAINFAIVNISEVETGVCSMALRVQNYGYINTAPGGSRTFKITGDCSYSWLYSYSLTSINFNNSSITLTGTPDFGIAFAFADRLGLISLSGVTFTGSGTGKRYRAERGGIIITFGGATFLPGNEAGTVATQGQYL